MLMFLVKRLFYIMVVLFIVSIFIFFLFRAMPICPTDIMMSEVAGDMHFEDYQRMRQELRDFLRLDEPWPLQFGVWFWEMVQGNFGYSFFTRLSVVDSIRVPMANTIMLNILNLILVFAIVIPAGVYAAIKRGKLFDQGVLFATLIGFSFPGFLFALLLILVFAILIPIFPIGGMSTVLPPYYWTNWDHFLDRLYFMALPLLTLVLMGTATLLRIVRSSMIDSLTQDFVRTARAKGLAEKTVIYSHAFRNALIPIITVMTGWFIAIFGGSMVIEQVFSWNGMGRVMLQALLYSDTAILKAMNVFYALIAFVGLLLMDIAYIVVDPRIRFD
ncbi:MAG: ABC transporter permease [Defluviitaleaceae bacterium]|nr:ABC transporter permease [Defluviitaleaceae bacterium]